MSLPMLQVALDNQTLSDAYETTRLIAEEVDIIEVGTILCVGEGVRAVRDLKALYPHKIVLADAKIADAGKILSRMCFEANADWVTVICCADINTAKGALDVAKEFNGDVQIELTGFWTWEQAQAWRDAGIQQVVYHRSRDAQAAGVATLLGCDNVQDAFCPAGSYDPLDTLACGLFSAQLSDLFDRQSRLICDRAALTGSPADAAPCAVGAAASVVIFPGSDRFTWPLNSAARLVVNHGRLTHRRVWQEEMAHES